MMAFFTLSGSDRNRFHRFILPLIVWRSLRSCSPARYVRDLRASRERSVLVRAGHAVFRREVTLS